MGVTSPAGCRQLQVQALSPHSCEKGTNEHHPSPGPGVWSSSEHVVSYATYGPGVRPAASLPLGSSAGKEELVLSQVTGIHFNEPLLQFVGLDREPSVCAQVSPPSGAQGGAPGNRVGGGGGWGAGVSPISVRVGTPDSPGQGELCRPATR